jgi:hypothetical protein
MTADQMAFKAAFAKINPIMTREVVQFIFEVPTDEADAALKLLGGMPKSRSERWCAIARLDLEHGNGGEKTAHSQHVVGRRAFSNLPFPQQAGILSKDAAFQYWINDGFLSEQDCAAGIRKRCGVESRSDLQAGTPAGEKWLSLLREFEGREIR